MISSPFAKRADKGVERISEVRQSRIVHLRRLFDNQLQTKPGQFCIRHRCRIEAEEGRGSAAGSIEDEQFAELALFAERSANETVRWLARAGGVYTMRYTRSVAKTVPVREFRTRLSELLSDVADRRDHVLVTRNGKPAAALVPIDEYEALEETAEILSDSATLGAIEAGLAELARDEAVTLAALRAELAERRATR